MGKDLDPIRGLESIFNKLDPTESAKTEKGLKKAEKKRQEVAARQRQSEAARLAEAEGAVAERRASALPGRAGRSLLIATSPTGTRAQTLGGV